MWRLNSTFGPAASLASHGHGQTWADNEQDDCERRLTGWLGMNARDVALITLPMTTAVEVLHRCRWRLWGSTEVGSDGSGWRRKNFLIEKMNRVGSSTPDRCTKSTSVLKDLHR
ncbi:hypothetical protein NL676_039215 [Syzygium grande]|nr:hypothetical protein NL676_039215 [Syzygium grande]